MGRKIQFKRGISSTNNKIKEGSFIETDGILAINADNPESYWTGGATIIYLDGTEVTLDKEAFEIWNKHTTSSGMIPDTRK